MPGASRFGLVVLPSCKRNFSRDTVTIILLYNFISDASIQEIYSSGAVLYNSVRQWQIIVFKFML